MFDKVNDSYEFSFSKLKASVSNGLRILYRVLLKYIFKVAGKSKQFLIFLHITLM